MRIRSPAMQGAALKARIFNNYGSAIACPSLNESSLQPIPSSRYLKLRRMRIDRVTNRSNRP
jgi:hypothetical protein